MTAAIGGKLPEGSNNVVLYCKPLKNINGQFNNHLKVRSMKFSSVVVSFVTNSILHPKEITYLQNELQGDQLLFFIYQHDTFGQLKYYISTKAYCKNSDFM